MTGPGNNSEIGFGGVEEVEGTGKTEMRAGVEQSVIVRETEWCPLSLSGHLELCVHIVMDLSLECKAEHSYTSTKIL